MGPKANPPKANDSESADEVVGAFDSIGGTAAFVVSDIAREDAWLAMPTETVLDLEEFQ